MKNPPRIVATLLLLREFDHYPPIKARLQLLLHPLLISAIELGVGGGMAGHTPDAHIVRSGSGLVSGAPQLFKALKLQI